ncbi:AzlD domain-containing protein [Vibrio sp. LaRot3]|uniref:AzlD domain-containing protein n=1 Tax=Vibrio sp. LaRot3 TaxID=2998829 RepID=UPI0022CDD276|nr:AzlD domain-containing protein [Vibrio sp. LaRot3]MDA0150613.1 AzlD domain-containing protein [Vibrio sp. LaRot3]
MIMLSILAMALLVFTSRYLFLEPKLPIRLPNALQRVLSYSAPAVLTAIWAPIVFLPEGELWLSTTNPYLISAVVAAVIVYKTRNVLLTTIVSMLLFLLLKNVLFTA